MNDFVTYNEPERPSHTRRWFWLIPVGLLLAGCCAWSGLGAWFFAPLMPFWANRLSYVQGKAEVIAPAQWIPAATSPPMAATWSWAGHKAASVRALCGIWRLVNNIRSRSTSALCAG